MKFCQNIVFSLLFLFVFGSLRLGVLLSVFAEERLNPVAWYKLDEGKGQTTRDLISGNDATFGSSNLSGSDKPVWLLENQCVKGKCLKFDGENDFVNLGELPGGKNWREFNRNLRLL